jgi:hypothetical protein
MWPMWAADKNFKQAAKVLLTILEELVTAKNNFRILRRKKCFRKIFFK